MKPSRRRKARELMVQALYATQVGGIDLSTAVGDQLERRNPGPEVVAYVRELSSLLAEGFAPLDARIDPALEGWSPERVGAVERAILRLAVAELLHQWQVPAPVVLHEAVELAQTFSTDEAAGFVNAVLDRIRKELEAEPPTS